MELFEILWYYPKAKHGQSETKPIRKQTGLHVCMRVNADPAYTTEFQEFAHVPMSV